MAKGMGHPERREVIFEVRDAEEGRLFARALGHAVFTEGDTWDKLRANALVAIAVHFEDASERPRLIQPRYAERVCNRFIKQQRL